MKPLVHKAAPSRGRSWALPILSLVAICIGIYYPVVEFGLIDAWDDGLYFLHRPEVRRWFDASWTERLLTPELGYPVPLPTLLYYLVQQLPPAWIVPAAHVLNLVFHTASVILAYLLAKRWTDRWTGFFATALWAAHPLLVESVAWITNLKVVLLAFFVFGGMLAWQQNVESSSTRLKLTALGCVVGAMLCRPEAVVLPAAYALLSAWHHQPTVLLDRRHSWPIWASTLMAAAYLPLAVLGQDEALAATQPDLSFGERLERMGAAFSIQLRHVVQPLNLHPGYYPDYDGVATDAALGLALATALGALTLYTWRRHRAFLGLGLFWLFYIPASGISVLPRFTADTYLYIPLFGLTVALVLLVGEALADKRPSMLKFAAALAVLATAALSLVSYYQGLRWRNGVTLWKPVIEAYPDQAQPYWIVGQTYARNGAHKEALEIFLQGEETFYARQRVPLAMAEELLRAGRAKHAAHVAATILTYEGLKDPAAGLFFAWNVCKSDLPLSAGERFDRAFVAAAQRLIQQPPEWPAHVYTCFAEHLSERGLDQWADDVLALRKNAPR